MVKNFVYLFSIIFMFFSNVALAEERIIVEGNHKISKQTVIHYLKIDSVLNKAAVNKAVKNLYDTGFFQDIKANVKSDRLYITVVENPIAKSVQITGNDKIKTKDMQKLLLSKKGEFYSDFKLARDKKTIIAMYSSNGFLNCKVEAKVEKLNKEFVSIKFNVDEGKPPKISAINFVGNKQFRSKELLSHIISEKKVWYKFFTNNDLYMVERIEVDKKRLKDFYWRNGFVDFEMKSVSSELAPDNKSLIVTFFLDEGERFNFGNADFDIKNIKVVGKDLQPLLQFAKGEIFNDDLLELTKYKISKYFKDKNILFVDVDYELQINRSKKIVNIKFSIKKGERFYVHKINFIGNIRTADNVIRRELVIGEGDPFNSSAIEISKRNLENLGYFKSVNISNKLLPVPEMKDININVEEQSTGTLKFSAGYNSALGPVGDISFSEYNFLGKGQNVELNFNKAKRTSNIEFSFNEPRFRDRNLLLGYDVFMSQLDKTKESSYSEKKRGGKLRMGYAINHSLYHKITYTLRKERITASSDANAYVKAQPKNTLLSSIGHSFIFDKLDNRIFPTSGYILKLNQTFGGVGGDEKFIKHDFEGKYFKQVLAEDVILSFIGRGGNIVGYGSNNVSISNSFFVGEEYIRGFDSDGIGPRYKNDPQETQKALGNALGGKNFLSSTVELQFPVGIPKEYGFKGAVFYDAAMLFGTDAYKYKAEDGSDLNPKNKYDSKFVRMSYGVGILWDSPLGPIRLDYGIPFRKVKGVDVTQRIRFSIISNF